jgi:hypothetical protein
MDRGCTPAAPSQLQLLGQELSDRSVFEVRNHQITFAVEWPFPMVWKK